VIELRNISKRFGDTVAVDDVSLTVRQGELLALLGGSGSGKTTTLKMVNRLIEPSAGAVIIDGEDVRSAQAHVLRRSIGYCFQRIGLFPHMTVGDNIGVTPTLLGWPKARIAARVEELLELVELPAAEFRDRYPKQLSGGQQQRVGVARALAAQPRVVLFDEPFGALDPLTRDRLQESLGVIRKRVTLTAMFVTHDMVEALLLADRIAVMSEGRLLQIGTPHELLAAPANSYVEQLINTPARQSERVRELFATALGPGWQA
jgi:osmoprotectant transport system ATP-binding protein